RLHGAEDRHDARDRELLEDLEPLLEEALDDPELDHREGRRRLLLAALRADELLVDLDHVAVGERRERDVAVAALAAVVVIERIVALVIDLQVERGVPDLEPVAGAEERLEDAPAVHERAVRGLEVGDEDAAIAELELAVAARDAQVVD